MLLGRYHTAIELMDAKLAAFYAEATRLGLLDDTLLVILSDHGEGFGEHGLYLHDSTVYETHLHVPLYVRHPRVAPHAVDDVVSTRDCFALLRAAGETRNWEGTILEPGYRAQRPIALAEHFHYPHAPRMAPQYRQDLVAAITATRKLVVRREGAFLYDLKRDPGEEHPAPVTASHFESVWHADGCSPQAIGAVGPFLRRAASARSTPAAPPRHPTPLEAIP